MSSIGSQERTLVEVPVRMNDHIFDDLAADLSARQAQRVLLVADERTFQACGQPVQDAVSKAGIPLETLVFPGQPMLSADEASIDRVMGALDNRAATLIAVGSGTITDIVRYAAYQTQQTFLSVPTAASVDAYTSFTASITRGGVKYSLPTQPARCVYVHVPTLAAAPPRMTASGFSDMLAKYTALADWKLAHLLNDDAYNAAVAQHALEAANACARHAGAIQRAEPAGIAALIDALMISGRCMVTVKNSRPAAGAEHSLAHFWEINHQYNHLPASLHGEKTGVALVLIARLYEALRRISPGEAALRLADFRLPDVREEAEHIQSALGPMAAGLIANQPSFLGGLRDRIEGIKSRLLTQWDDVQAIAATVPSADEILAWLHTGGALSSPAQIHVPLSEVQQAVKVAMYVRDRLTILELNRMLGLDSPG